jgi:beta-mannosidase
MSNPAQPSFVWQLYSHDLEPNAALFGTRKACEPVHIMMNQSNGHLMVVNNEPRRLAGLTANVAVYNLDGRNAYARSLPLAAEASATTDLGAIAFPPRLSAVHFVRLELMDARKRVLSSNFYWRADPAHPNDLTALNRLPRVTLQAGAARHDVGGKCFVKVTLRNPTSAVALMAHIQLRRAASGRRVLPVFYSDNYISLLPGESRTLTVEAAQADLGGEAPLIVVDGWNVDVAPVSPPGRAVHIAPNSDAMKTDGPGLEISPA